VLLVAIVFGIGLVGLAWAALAAGLVGGIGSATLFIRQAHWGFRLKVSPDVLRQLVSFGFYSLLGTIGWYLAYASDAVVIGTALTAVDVARFGIASTVVVLLSGMVGAFSGSFLPLGSALDAGWNREALERSYMVGTKIALVMGLPCVVALGFCGPDLLSLWVGPDLGDASGHFMRILLLAYLPAMGNAVGFQIALGAGLHRQVAFMSAFEGVCHVGLAYLLAVRIGLYGVGIAALTVTFGVHGIIWPLYLCKRLRIVFGRYWTEGLRPALLPVIPAVVGYGMSRLVLPGHGGLWGIAAAALFVVVYWSCALFICFSRGERRAWAQEAKNAWPLNRAIFGRGSL
jgi:O-antigen/teichoic acid export membrane protein